MENENNGQNDIFNNIQRIKALSEMFGGEGSAPNAEDLKKTVEMARKISNVMGIMNDKDNDNDEPDKPYIKPKAIDDKSIGIINAAIPFMDKDLQKSIFIAIKVLEVKKLNSESKIYTQSIEKFDKVQKRKHMLSAIAPYLNPEERRRIKMILKFMDMSKVMNT